MLIYPMVIGMEVLYFDKIGENPEFIWAMISLLFLVLMVTVFMFLDIKKSHD
jgi:hypothetical protein